LQIDKAQQCGINNTIQKISKSLGRRGIHLTFTAFLFGDLPAGVTMGKKMLKISATGRKCTFPHCTHILSIYNHDTYCRIHLEQVAREQKSTILTGTAALIV
jgi:hypothetical protein